MNNQVNNNVANPNVQLEVKQTGIKLIKANWNSHKVEVCKGMGLFAAGAILVSSGVALGGTIMWGALAASVALFALAIFKTTKTLFAKQETPKPLENVKPEIKSEAKHEAPASQGNNTKTKILAAVTLVGLFAAIGYGIHKYLKPAIPPITDHFGQCGLLPKFMYGQKCVPLPKPQGDFCPIIETSCDFIGMKDSAIEKIRKNIVEATWYGLDLSYLHPALNAAFKHNHPA